jgi:hypothetical protein
MATAWVRAKRRLLGCGKEREVGWLGREKRRWFFLSISMNSRKIQRDGKISKRELNGETEKEFK